MTISVLDNNELVKKERNCYWDISVLAILREKKTYLRIKESKLWGLVEKM